MRSPPVVAPLLFVLLARLLSIAAASFAGAWKPFSVHFLGPFLVVTCLARLGRVLFASGVLSCTVMGCLVIHHNAVPCAVRIHHQIDSMYMFVASCVLCVRQLCNPYCRGSVAAPTVATRAPRMRASGVLPICRNAGFNFPQFYSWGDRRQQRKQEGVTLQV